MSAERRARRARAMRMLRATQRRVSEPVMRDRLMDGARRGDARAVAELWKLYRLRLEPGA